MGGGNIVYVGGKRNSCRVFVVEDERIIILK